MICKYSSQPLKNKTNSLNRYTLAWDEVLTTTLGPRAQQALIAADQGMNEARNGAAITMPIIVWVAKKAEA
jgi:hypothetical protein